MWLWVEYMGPGPQGRTGQLCLFTSWTTGAFTFSSPAALGFVGSEVLSPKASFRRHKKVPLTYDLWMPLCFPRLGHRQGHLTLVRKREGCATLGPLLPSVMVNGQAQHSCPKTITVTKA